MYHVVHCRCCCASHSHLENYLFDDHDRVIDVLMNLDVRVMNDDHCDVQVYGNVCDLNIKKKSIDFSSRTILNTYGVCVHGFDFGGDLE